MGYTLVIRFRQICPPPRRTAGNLVEIVAEIYAAAEDPKAWSNVLRLLGVELGSTFNVFVLNDRQSPGGQVAVTKGAESRMEQDYNSYYHSVNVLLQRVQGSLTQRRLLISQEIIEDSDLLETEYYQGFLKRWDIFYFIGGVVTRTSTANALISLARPRDLGPYSAAEKETVSLLMPHLRRAVRLSGEFARIRQERDALLDRISMGYIVLNGDSKITFMNRSAERILQRNDGVCSSANGFSATASRESAQLRKLISDATLTSAGKAASGGGSMAVTRSCGRPLTLLVSPLMPSVTLPLTQEPGAVVFLTDPDAGEPSHPERIAAMFGLTPAESKMADQLVQGRTLAEAAEHLGITQLTARVHLKRIFGKTCTSNRVSCFACSCGARRRYGIRTDVLIRTRPPPGRAQFR
jgi:DNA-binding CsgD family transcriptional regulator/PAS domain-containing protein